MYLTARLKLMTLVLSIKSKTFLFLLFRVSFSLEVKKPILQLLLRGCTSHGILCSGDAIQIFLDFLLAAHFPPIFCVEHCALTATMQ